MTNSSTRLLYVLDLSPSMQDRLRPHRNSQSSVDPLSVNLQPPPNETEVEKAARLEAAREAVRVSRSIDAGLVESKRAMERKKRAVKILLLGSWPAAAPMHPCIQRLWRFHYRAIGIREGQTRVIISLRIAHPIHS